jgi:CHAT domain-containing protein
VLRALVQNYLEQLTDPRFRPARGLRLVPRDPKQPLPAQRPELLTDILLPAAARAHLQAAAPECLIIIPDGALHKLPFEALPWRAGARPEYVLDQLPPLVYAPSVASLGRLSVHRPAPKAGPQSLLTVRPTSPAEWRQLLPLQHAAEESQKISAAFDPKRVLALHGPQATEKAVVAALPGRHVVHIAAHGVADERFGGLFGAVVLTPADPKAPQNDGFLTLQEICTLPLEQCELAVLSACFTNVGPQPPLEAGVTLANGFLAAGARRVVASHWGVDDESTAELMSAFFREVTTTRTGYARALQQARRQVRDRERWSAPYFWAPFVLVGPAD